MLSLDFLDFSGVKENLTVEFGEDEKDRQSHTDQDTQRWNLQHGNRTGAKKQEKGKQPASSQALQVPLLCRQEENLDSATESLSCPGSSTHTWGSPEILCRPGGRRECAALGEQLLGGRDSAGGDAFTLICGPKGVGGGPVKGL